MLTEQKFWLKVNKTPSCWIWRKHLEENGYGRVWTGVKMVLAHRLSYELIKGKIPKGLQLDHLCRNRACVNPSHLEAVLGIENISRSPIHNKNKTHCIHGHEFTPENTHIFKIRKYSGFGRQCKICLDNNNKRFLNKKIVEAKK